MKDRIATKSLFANAALLACLVGALCIIPAAKANKMMPSTTPLNPDEPPSVVLPMEAKQPGDYNFQATVAAGQNSVPTQPYSGGKLGMITPVLLNGLKYVDLATGLEMPPPWANPSSSGASSTLPPEPVPEPTPGRVPESMPPPPPPRDHGRIMSVGRDPDNPRAVLITYQDGTVERVFPPSK